MHIAIIGATGLVGTAVLREALARGHQVDAIVRHPDRLPPHPQLAGVQGDVFDTAGLAARLEGRQAVISAFSGHAHGAIRERYVAGLRSIVAAVKSARVPRFLLVGGAGSLEVAPGLQLVDTPDFPAQWKESALGARDALNLLRAEGTLDWTMLSPPAYLHPGERTGTFRLGRDRLLQDPAGKSAISLEDFAVALIDELERPAHARQRFTVAY